MENPELPPLFDSSLGHISDLTLNISDATKILQKYLPSIESCSTLEEIKRSYNNKIYCLNSTYILRLSGRTWTKYKTEGEICAIRVLRSHFPELPVPKMYDFSSSSTESIIQSEYILMEKLPGEPLDIAWDNLSLDKKYLVVKQTAKIFHSFKSLRYKKIGSFILHDSGTGHGIGQIMEQKIGPFTTYLDYFRELGLHELNNLKTCKYMLEGYGKRSAEIIQRIHKFTETVSNPTTTPLPTEVYQNVPFVFHHGDFEARNLLVHPETGTITGLLDFDFCGSFPIDNDWFDGLGFLGARTSDWEIFNEPNIPEWEQDVRDPDEVKQFTNLFLSEIHKLDPVSCGGKKWQGHKLRADLYYFVVNICPWYLTGTDCFNGERENALNERNLAISRVEKVLNKYGF